MLCQLTTVGQNDTIQQ